VVAESASDIPGYFSSIYDCGVRIVADRDEAFSARWSCGVTPNLIRRTVQNTDILPVPYDKALKR
jgi:hypothetical protein